MPRFHRNSVITYPIAKRSQPGFEAKSRNGCRHKSVIPMEFADCKKQWSASRPPGKEKNMLTKKVQGSEESENIFSTEIESFRLKQDMTVKEFCTPCHISRPQYSEYVTGKNRYLLITDAVRLLAAFPGKITVSKLLRWSGEKRLALSRSFPHIFFRGTHRRMIKRLRLYLVSAQQRVG